MSTYNILNISMINESFNSKNAAEFQLEPSKLNDGIRFEIQSRHIKDNVHEVSMRLILSTEKEDKTPVFEAQATCAGLFEIAGFNQEDFDKVIKVHCASAIYPYCRERIQNLISASPFTIGMLPTLNFAKMYEDQAFQNEKLPEENA